MKYILIVDQWILARFEGFCHWSQRMFGTSCLDYARWSCLGSATAAIFYFGNLFLRDRGGRLWFDAIALFLLLILRAIEMVALHALEPENRSRAIRGVSNPRKLDSGRIAFLAYWVVFLRFDIHNLNFWFELATAFQYFVACDDLPPGVSRARQAIESIKSLVRVPVSVRQ